jgi:putative oxidoreductase
VDAVFLIGRIVFPLLFVGSAFGHLTKTAAMAEYAQYRGVPAARLSVLVTGAQLLIGGLSVALGVWGDLGALLLLLFLVPTAFLMHAFWKESDPQAKATEQAQFMKNISLAGAALVLFVVFASGHFGLTLTDPLIRLS